MPARLIGAVRTLQAFTNERLARARFRRRSSAPMPRRAGRPRRARVLTAIAIFLVFASVVVVLWVGAQDVMAQRISAGRLGQFVLYAVFAAGGLGELSQVWGEISRRLRRGRAAVRDSRRCARHHSAGAAGRAADARARRGRVPQRALRLSDARRTRRCSTAFRFVCGRARKWRWSARPAPAKARSSISSCASTIRSPAA